MSDLELDDNVTIVFLGKLHTFSKMVSYVRKNLILISPFSSLELVDRVSHSPPPANRKVDSLVTPLVTPRQSVSQSD